MPPAVSPSLIARLTQRRPRTLRQLEPADMGTCFGMEQWLDERAQLAPVGHAAPARRTWLPRWFQPVQR